MTAVYASRAELQRFLNISGTADFSETQLDEALERATVDIDEMTNNRFTIAGTATPNYNQVTNEKHDGQGKYDRGYYLDNYPLPSVSATTSGTTSISSATVVVGSTDGFLASGVLGIGALKVTYSSKSGTSFLGCSGVSSTVSPSGTVVPYVVEMSVTSSGTEPTWNILQEDSEFDIDKDTGRVHIYRDDVELSAIYNLTAPPRLVPNRFRASYIWGTTGIPLDIKRLCLMLASKELMHSIVRRATIQGLNDFRPELIGVDDAWITETAGRYSLPKCKNV